MATYNYKPGLGNAASYEVSGIPFVSGGIDCLSDGGGGGGGEQIKFPSTTRWVAVSNDGANGETVRIAFSSNGLLYNNNYYEVPEGQQSPRLEVKCTEIHLSGSSKVSVMAGLTYIATDQINNPAISPSGSNWSGSLAALVG
jgi:hypothetical protein